MIESTRALAWRRARRCGSGSCVEVATEGERVFVRDSKHPQSDALEFNPQEWAAFVAGVREGEFDF